MAWCWLSPSCSLIHLLCKTEGETLMKQLSPCCGAVPCWTSWQLLTERLLSSPCSGDKLDPAARSRLCFSQLSIKHVLNRSTWVILLTWTWADERAVRKKQHFCSCTKLLRCAGILLSVWVIPYTPMFLWMPEEKWEKGRTRYCRVVILGNCTNKITFCSLVISCKDCQ